MERTELLSSREYWLFKIQLKLFHELTEYMRINNLTKEQMADKLQVSVPYITAILNGNARIGIQRMVDMFILMEKAVVLNTPTLEDYQEQERLGVISPYETLYPHYFAKENEL